ncbi:MAG: PH domain-containing protein [Thermoflexales bacterium]|nr:PH domain-containing protein [Thermoflexales bacterium]
MTASSKDRLSLERTLRALRDAPALKGLADPEFQRITAAIRAESLTKGRTLITPGENNTNLYIVRRGQMGLRRLEDEGVRSVNEAQIIPQGGIVNAHSFLTGARNNFSAEAETDLDLAVIPRADFKALLDKDPGLPKRMEVAAETRAALDLRRQYPWIVDGESISIFERRHIWWFFSRAMLPLLALVGTLIVALSLPFLLWVCALIAVFLVLWAAWYYVDWSNDYYALTNYRVLHRERVLFMRDDQEEAPLDKVQNTSVTQTSVWAQLLDYGDVHIETAGTGAAVTFEMVRHPRKVSEQIVSLRDRAKTLVWATEHQKLRTDMRVAIKLAPKPEIKAQEAKPYRTPMQTRWDNFVKAVRNARNTLLPRTRIVEGDKVTFRKHWLRLVETAGPQFLIFFMFFPVLFALFLFDSWFRRVIGEGFLVYAFFTLLTLGWFIWRYEDWRNDIYVLDKDRLIDIDRSPFGLLGAKRKEARYDSIQNVSATTRGPVDLLLNVGDVVVKTGGADNALTFERVYNPVGVQQELQRKIEVFKAGQQQKDIDQRRRDLVEAIGIYDELRSMHGQRTGTPTVDPETKW